MEAVATVLILLVAVVIGSAVSRVLPFNFPTPLVQVALGIVLGLIAPLRVELEPELFLLVFLPPLLFLDGWRIPKDELFHDLSAVVGLALGLVLLTVAGAGLFIHWMIPALPLSLSFALAAVISPTDPVAVSAIAARVPVPRRMMHILEGESLLNDASGLVCLRFAVAAALTGSFSFGSAILTFSWLAVGGIAVGVGVTLAISFAKGFVSDRFGEDTGSQILTSLLMPFAAYLVADGIGCSGILAAVAAGVTMTYAEISRQALAATRIRRNSVWDLVQFALNGIIFVLLGEQLPGIVAEARRTVEFTGHGNPWWLVLYVFAIVAALAVLRFVWVWVSLQLTLFRQGKAASARSPDWRIVTAMSVAGVRGTVTLAGVLTIPISLADGAPFPGRELAVLLASGVIIASLVIANAGLPVLLKGLAVPHDPSRTQAEDDARVAAARAAIQAIETAQRGEKDGGNADAAARIVDSYQQRIGSILESADKETAYSARNSERHLYLIGLKAERDEIYHLARSRKIKSQLTRKLVHEIDLAEARYNNPV